MEDRNKEPTSKTTEEEKKMSMQSKQPHSATVSPKGDDKTKYYVRLKRISGPYMVNSNAQ